MSPSPSYQALLLDLSGVIYQGSEPIPGARETLALARQRQLCLRFVTNTATKPAAAIRRDLQQMGIAIAEQELYTAPLAAVRYLQSRQLRPFCLTHPAIASDLAQLDQTDPNCVLIGDAREALNYRNLNTAFQLCQRGAPLIGIGMNKYFQGEDGLMLDAGGFIRLIEWAADSPALIMGKPSATFFQQVVDSTGYPVDQCLMVGDDLEADVLGAIDAGLQGCLVKTGKYQPGDQQRLGNRGRVIASIARLLD